MISIITPVYNVENLIHRCIISILSQTYSDFELLLIDDGSTDSSGKICDEYAGKDSRIIVFHNENHGCSYARNFGLDQAKGDYICFIDSDDFIHEDFLKVLLSLLEKNHADISICNYSNVDCYGTVIDKSAKTFSSKVTTFSSNEIAKEVYKNTFVPFVVVWNKLYSRKIWSTIRFVEGLHCEDEEIIQKIYHLADKIIFQDTPLYYYTQNDFGIIHSPQNSLANLIDRSFGLFHHIVFLCQNSELETVSEAFHRYFAICVQVLTQLKHSSFTSKQKEVITFKKFLRRFKNRYKEVKKSLNFNWKRKIYYTLFFAFPRSVIFIRSIKSKMKTRKPI